MPASRRQVEILGRSFERSRTLAALLFAGAVTFIVGGVAVGGAVGTVLAAIGSTLGTTALASFLYDPFLKEVLAQEIFDKVGLRESIVRAGLEDVGRDSGDLDLAGVLRGSRCIKAVPFDPFMWAREMWPAVVAAAESRPTEVKIALPSPDASPARTILSHRLDTAENELDRQLSKLPEELGKAWDRAQVHEDSQLLVSTHDRFASTGLLTYDDGVVLETGPALTVPITEKTLLVQRFRADSAYYDWAESQLVETFERATPAEVRPVTAPSDLPGRSFETEEGERTPASKIEDGAISTKAADLEEEVSSNEVVLDGSASDAAPPPDDDGANRSADGP